MVSLYTKPGYHQYHTWGISEKGSAPLSLLPPVNFPSGSAAERASLVAWAQLVDLVLTVPQAMPPKLGVVGSPGTHQVWAVGFTNLMQIQFLCQC